MAGNCQLLPRQRKQTSKAPHHIDISNETLMDNSDDRSGGLYGVSTLTDSNTDDTDRIILHVDCDCFYAACERTRHAELEDEPVIIGMGYEADTPHGAVATASYEAREYGVESAMAIGDALEHLPRMEDADADDPSAPDPTDAGYYRPVDMEFYEDIGGEVHDILAERCDTFEPVSIDEAYLDVTSNTTWADIEGFAREIKETIQTDVGVPVSIGVAPTKSAAKVASDHDKPDGLVVVEPGDVRSFFAPLDVEEVHGIGPVTASTLREMGIETAGDLAVADPDDLTAEFGDRGREVHQRARGHDPREVTPPDDPKSISNESSFGDAVTNLDEKREKVRELAGKVTDRADSKEALYQTVGIKVVTPPFDVNTRARTFSGPVSDPELVESTALDLLTEFTEAKIRKVGVRVSNLSFEGTQQPGLDQWGSEESNGGSDASSSDTPSLDRPSRQNNEQMTFTDFTE